MTIQDMSLGCSQKLSFVIPCYRSEHTVGLVIDEIQRVLNDTGNSIAYEIVCVVDGSPDDVFSVLSRIAREDNHIKVVSLAKNSGKHAALLAGFSYVTGDYVIAVDDDGECPVSELWRLLEPLYNGYDVSLAHYGRRPVSAIKELEHSVNAFMVRKLVGKPKELEFSNFSARKRFVADYLVRYSGPYPYLEGETLAITRNIAMVDMPASSRISGSSGFTFGRGLRLFINGCTTYSVVPLRLSNYLGLACLAVALVALVFALVTRGGFLTTILFTLFGLQFLMLGLLGEYVGRLYMVANQVPQYVIRETINCEGER